MSMIAEVVNGVGLHSYVEQPDYKISLADRIQMRVG
jgi:hypothetical protein